MSRLWLILLWGILPATNAAEDSDRDADRLGGIVVRTVRDHFFDAEAAGVWATSHLDYASSARTQREFATLTNRALDDLHASHTHYYTPLDLEYYGLLAIFRETLGVGALTYEGIGVDLDPQNVIRVVFAGGPAAKAGLLRGDQILSADGEPFHPVLSFRGRSDDVMTLRIRRRENEPTLEARVRPRRVDPAREWLEAQRQGTKIYHHKGKRVAYVPIFSCAGEEPEDRLREAISDLNSTTDALILDLRDGWGGCNPSFLNLFSPLPPVLTVTERDGTSRVVDSQWRKPLVLLINGRSRSGKELVAHAVKAHKLGTLVGEPTGGAVLAGRPFLLPDLSLLYLAVADVKVDGQRLEGHPIEPDVVVSAPLRFAAGRDPQLETALDVAARIEKPAANAP